MENEVIKLRSLRLALYQEQRKNNELWEQLHVLIDEGMSIQFDIVNIFSVKTAQRYRGNCRLGLPGNVFTQRGVQFVQVKRLGDTFHKKMVDNFLTSRNPIWRSQPPEVQQHTDQYWTDLPSAIKRWAEPKALM